MAALRERVLVERRAASGGRTRGLGDRGALLEAARDHEVLRQRRLGPGADAAGLARA